jgi:hypothetical protein
MELVTEGDRLLRFIALVGGSGKNLPEKCCYNYHPK